MTPAPPSVLAREPAHAVAADDREASALEAAVHARAVLADDSRVAAVARDHAARERRRRGPAARHAGHSGASPPAGAGRKTSV